MAFFVALMMSVLLCSTVAYIATTSKVQPFIVETHEGMPYAISKMQSISVQDEKLINFAINQFILNARTVVKDNAAQTALLDKVYAYSANQTLSFLHDYYQQHNPFEMATHATVTVSMVSSLPMSHDTWQITWDETEHNVSDGSTIKTTRWVANLTYQLGDVNPRFINDNPFGFYITQIIWAPTLQGVSS
jgi:type IV secretory pathway TrbF-like protein